MKRTVRDARLAPHHGGRDARADTAWWTGSPASIQSTRSPTAFVLLVLRDPRLPRQGVTPRALPRRVRLPAVRCERRCRSDQDPDTGRSRCPPRSYPVSESGRRGGNSGRRWARSTTNSTAAAAACRKLRGAPRCVSPRTRRDYRRVREPRQIERGQDPAHCPAGAADAIRAGRQPQLGHGGRTRPLPSPAGGHTSQVTGRLFTP